MDHADLVLEMTQVERLPTQDRLHLARMQRAQQLKVAKQREKEWQKSQSRNKGALNAKSITKKHIAFQDSVVLLEAAARNDIIEVARLLEKGVSPDATNDDGLTALHQCCIDNNPDMLKLLLDYGANVNAEDSERWTPLHAAATCGHLYLVKLLISRGANLLSVNADGNMPYDLCDNEETLDFIEAEMSQRGVTQELIDNTRASTELKMLYDLELIAARGGDLEVPDSQGATPLHIAAANGYIRVVEYLLEHHISVDAVDNDFWTPVHAAACWGHLEVLEILVQNGADLNAKNKNEETPADICEDAEIREKIEELRTEQESKRLAEAQKRRVRRSQSNNTRVHSVRRTSIRDKTLTTKKDAAEETRLRLQAQEGYTTTDGVATQPNSITSDNQSSTTNRRPSNSNNPTASLPSAQPISSNVLITSSNTTQDNKLNNNNNNNNNTISNNKNHLNNNNNNSNHINSNNNYQNQNPLYNISGQQSITSNNTSTYQNNSLYDLAINRRSPEGKDNDSFIPEDNNKKQIPIHGSSNNISGTQMHKNGGSDIQTGIFQATQENGKINVQVTVLVDTQNIDHSIAGTLADLKKHRAQTRSSNSPENGSIITSNSIQPIELSLVSSPELQNPNVKLSKFSGYTGDVVSDSTRSRKCCSLM